MSLASSENVDNFKITAMSVKINFKKEYVKKVGFDGQSVGMDGSKIQSFKTYKEFYDWYQGGMKR